MTTDKHWYPGFYGFGVGMQHGRHPGLEPWREDGLSATNWRPRNFALDGLIWDGEKCEKRYSIEG
jgi:hypothetical protein